MYHAQIYNAEQQLVNPNPSSEPKPFRQLPDILQENLDMIIIGIAPSAALGYSNHHFSGPGNHFWRCIYEVGLVPVQVSCEDDYKMPEYGIGFISFCTRPSKNNTEMSRRDIRAGASKMVDKIKHYRPKIVVFNGIGIYEAFVGNKNFAMGLQPSKMIGTDSFIFVMPSSSARCAQLPRAEDKLPFFISLRKLRDHIRGTLVELDEKEVVFPNYTEFRVTQPDPRSVMKAEKRRKRKHNIAAMESNNYKSNTNSKYSASVHSISNQSQSSINDTESLGPPDLGDSMHSDSNLSSLDSSFYSNSNNGFMKTESSNESIIENQRVSQLLTPPNIAWQIPSSSSSPNSVSLQSSLLSSMPTIRNTCNATGISNFKIPVQNTSNHQDSDSKPVSVPMSVAMSYQSLQVVNTNNLRTIEPHSSFSSTQVTNSTSNASTPVSTRRASVLNKRGLTSNTTVKSLLNSISQSLASASNVTQNTPPFSSNTQTNQSTCSTAQVVTPLSIAPTTTGITRHPSIMQQHQHQHQQQMHIQQIQLQQQQQQQIQQQHIIIPVSNPSLNTSVTSTHTISTTQQPIISYNQPTNPPPINVPKFDPITSWDLFMHGIDTGEHQYPAPPSALKKSINCDLMDDSLLYESLSRVLTVL